MTVGIRCDATPDIGAGHAMRCLGIGVELRKLGVEVNFFGEFSIPWVSELLLGAGFCHSELRNRDDPAAELAEAGVRTVLFDSYQTPELALKSLNSNFKLFQMCDTPPSPGLPWHTIYPYFGGPENSPLALSGPEYLPIRDSFIGTKHSGDFQQSEEVQKILILVGATDNFEEKVKMLELVGSVAPEVEIYLNVNEADTKLNGYLSNFRQNLHAGNYAGDLRPILSEVDAVFTLAGTTTWELFVAQIPTIIYAAFDNQQIVAETCALLGIDTIRREQNSDNIYTLSNRLLLSRFMRDKSFRDTQVKLAAAQLDTKGSRRIASWILERNGVSPC
jgi:spore coat polysaccharide biosynthesis predicted glycosyltransferase SpsG